MWDGVEDVGKNTEIYVFERLFNDFGPKLVQKVPYGSGVSENGLGIKKTPSRTEKLRFLRPDRNLPDSLSSAQCFGFSC